MPQRRRSKGKKKTDDFVRLTGLWRPDDRNAKQLGQGAVKLEQLEELLEAIEEKGGDAAFVYLFKNEYAESKSDPRYVLTALPLEARDNDDDDEDDEPRRRRKKKKAPAKKRRRRQEEEDEDDGFDDDDDDDEDDDDIPF